MTITAQSIGIRITGISHARIRTSDLARARVFYLARLGFPAVLDGARQFVFRAGSSTISVCEETDDGARGDGSHSRAPLATIALACENTAELWRAARALTGAGIEHSGVQSDPALGKEYVAFRDPDGIEWELCRMA